MKKVLKKIRKTLRKFIQRVFHLDEIYRYRAKRLFKKRAQKKKKNGDPITVSFVCHDPALWTMFESLYNAMEKDLRFYPQVIVLSKREDIKRRGTLCNAEMIKYCKKHRLNMVEGFDVSRMKWRNPTHFDSDYLFFQTPYSFFSKAWSIKQVSRFSRVCYLPYGFALFEWFDSSNFPVMFLQHTHFIFNENEITLKHLKKMCRDKLWFSKSHTLVTGYPKLDYFDTSKKLNPTVWKRGLSSDVKRILWTPRWTTSEGNCHFFEYKDFFHTFCDEHKKIDFVFRPHPLCFQNFLKTGELSEKELENMRLKYTSSSTMSIDENYDYQDTFLTSDILISDISSMLIEYFITGKPIIYTYKIGFFNDFGKEFEQGFYWVKNKAELRETLNMLIQGNDPLFERRKRIIQEMIYRPEGGAGERIKELLYEDFLQEITS